MYVELGCFSFNYFLLFYFVFIFFFFSFFTFLFSFLSFSFLLRFFSSIFFSFTFLFFHFLFFLFSFLICLLFSFSFLFFLFFIFIFIFTFSISCLKFTRLFTYYSISCLVSLNTEILIIPCKSPYVCRALINMNLCRWTRVHKHTHICYLIYL